jgi:serine/threonine protein kinase
LRRQVALKVSKRCHDDAAADRITRFHREAQATAALQHPNIGPVYDVGQVDDLHFITMAYISGQSLQQRLTNSAAYSHVDAAALVRKLALAMQAAHDANVIHRDLKPSNIMINQQGEPIVMDFGLALLAESDHDARITHCGTLIGSPAYMSPEQTTGDPTAIGPGSDIYSLGVLFYEMLCGSLPFQGSIATIIHQIRNTEAKSLRMVRGDIDSGLQSIIEKMMSKSIVDRYLTMQAVADDLQCWIDKQSQLSEPQTSAAISPSHIDPAACSNVSPRNRLADSWMLASTSIGKRFCFGSPDGRTLRRRLLLLSSLFLLLALLATVITFQTPAGEVTIEVNDDRIGVELDGKQIKLHDARWTSPIKPGPHRFQVTVNSIQIPLADSQPIEIDGRVHRLLVSWGDVQLAAQEFEISRGKKRVLKIRLSPIETSATSDDLAQSHLQTRPWFADDYNVAQVFQADRDTRFVAGSGQLIVTRSKPHPGGGWWAWTRADIDNGMIDIDLRRVGSRGGWLIVLHNPATRKGSRVWLRDREIRVGPSIWDPQQRELSATLEHMISDDPPLRTDGGFDTLQLRVVDRTLKVILNGQELGQPTEFPYDLTPANLSVGIIGSKEGDCRVEYQRLMHFKN